MGTNSKGSIRMLSVVLTLVTASANAGSLEERQWALHNTGESQKIQIDDLTVLDLPGRVNEDIGLRGLPPENLVGQKIRVAILDTGVDYEHPNLKGQIVRKTEECDALQKYRECLKKEPQKTCDDKWSKVDADGNGYPLDCSGWNITTGINPLTGVYGSWDASDDTGHGTHLAGIIAAVADGIGIQGVSKNVEILPVKVIKTSPNAPIRPQSLFENFTLGALPTPVEKDLGWTNGFADQIARGMLYAIRSNAKVINLSLAWPSRADSIPMREMVKLAQDRGVLVVAAAGNDSADSRVMPCQYEGVICVASHGPDGAFSHFSNFGSFVDIAAPGLDILSTWPLNKRANTFTERTGYEYKNGTSMAAPYVAGALARLLAMGISPQEAYARLIAGSRPIQTSRFSANYKYIRSGNLDIGESLRVAPQPVILPKNKFPIQLSWDRKATVLPFTFSLKNYWVEGKNMTVNAEILPEVKSQFARLGMDHWEIPVWEAGAAKEFQSSLNIEDWRVDGRLLLLLKITKDGVSKSLRIPLEISVPVAHDFSDSEARTFPISGEALPEEMAIRTVTSLDGKPLQDYMAIGEGFGALKVQAIRQKGNSYEVMPTVEIQAPGADLLLIQRIDRFQDGKSHTVFVFRTPPPEKSRMPGFRFLFFDENMKFEEKIDYDNKASVISERFSWIKVEDQGKIRLAPFWIARGSTPDLDKPPFDPWDPEPNDPPFLRIYYLTSEGLRSISIPEKYSLVQILTQSPEQKTRGEAFIVVSEGDDYHLTYFIAELTNQKFTSTTPVRPLVLPKYRMLLGLENVLEVTSLDPQGKKVGTAISGSSVRGNLRTTTIGHPAALQATAQDRAAKVIDSVQKPSSVLDSVTRVSGVYLGEQREAIFSQTHYRLQYQDLATGEEASTTMDRFSFLPAFIFSKTFFPVVATNATGLDRLPGVLIPASLGISESVEVIVPVYHPSTQELLGLSHPARFRFEAGEGCAAIGDPIPANSTEPSQIAFFCQDRFFRIPLRWGQLDSGMVTF